MLTAPVVISVISLVATTGIGIATIRRLSNSDKALDIATNVQTTFDAQGTLINELQEETGRLRQDNRDKDDEIRALKAELREVHRELREVKAELRRMREHGS